MAIYDYDGTTNHEVGKVYDYDGTTNNQIGKIYDYNGTTDSLIYTSAVTLTNALNSQITNNNSWSDYGDSGGAIAGMGSYHFASGRRYLVYGTAGSYVWNKGDDGTGKVEYSRLELNYSTHFNGMIIVTGTGSSWSILHAWRRYNCLGNVTANLYMVVDITPLEEAVGRQLSASEAYAYTGTFYGSKEIEI